MPKFTTIAPTHIPGKKPDAWKQFLTKNYVAVGWLDDKDLTNVSADRLIKLIEQDRPPNIAEARSCLPKFRFEIGPGDYVAVNNVNHGLFGVGRIKSHYKFKRGKHDAGDGQEFYSHYRDVDWLLTDYISFNQLDIGTEQGWEPRGTIGRIDDPIPRYIQRLLTGSDEGIASNLQEEILALADQVLASGGQGFVSDAKLRIAIEKYSLEKAIEHYKSRGYAIEVKGKPYDLRCVKDGTVLYVEAKGTRLAGDVILLTPNEVAWAEKNPDSMEMFIVSDMEEYKEGEVQRVRGGVCSARQWKIDRARLSPMGYSYRLV